MTPVAEKQPYIKLLLSAVMVMLIHLSSCNPQPDFRKVEWKTEWEKNRVKLKALAQDILMRGNTKYSAGNNTYPEQFSYPFDEGFFISNANGATAGEYIDTGHITIKFYMDRGLLDHYSAIIFTNDAVQTAEFDKKVATGAGDYQLEARWYAIND